MINGILMQATGTLNAANEQIRATSSRFSRHRHSLMSPLLARFATAILGNYANSFTFRCQNFSSSSFGQGEREREREREREGDFQRRQATTGERDFFNKSIPRITNCAASESGRTAAREWRTRGGT